MGFGLPMMSLPIHLIIPAFLALTAISLSVFYRSWFLPRKYWRSFWISGLIFLGLYAFLVGFAAYQNISLRIQLDHYDLNQNGFLDGFECTDEPCKVLMRKLSDDTARTFSVITAGIFAAAVSLPILLAGLILERLRK